MKINRFYTFQQEKIDALQEKALYAHKIYQMLHTPQVISFTAPTGAGKTIMMAALIENIFNGTDKYPENPNAIFVWLSDSPELNQQSRDKIDAKADKVRLDQCVTITEESFCRETLEEGHIYFLNTQKLGKSSNLTKYSDRRQFTIWDTIRNTVEQKAENLYFIIDEAHRGMQDNRAATATTLMQRFIKGSPEVNLPAMPVVIGMSATSERFNALVKNTSSSIHPVVVTPQEVRDSGLLKDKIIIVYPDNTSTNEMALLEAATDDWIKKCDHWKEFCDRYHHAAVNPIFLIQVTNGSGTQISSTDLDVCLQKIEQRRGSKFDKGEVVHTFGQTQSSINMNGLEVPYVEPSNIAEDKTIRVVFFKENLSTGWDCPRAETMMSFRHAADATYIAQLLGRMVRTPIQSRIASDDYLNDVRLYLPYFDSTTVKKVVDELQGVEGGTLSTEIIDDSLSGGSYVMLQSNSSIKRRVPVKAITPFGQTRLPGFFTYVDTEETTNAQEDKPEYVTKVKVPSKPNEQTGQSSSQTTSSDTMIIQFDYEDVPRVDIIRYINELALTTFHVGNTQIKDYISSMFALARFLNVTKLNTGILKATKGEIVEMIHDYTKLLKSVNEYDKLKDDVLSFKLHFQVFDSFGTAYNQSKESSMFASSDINLDLQLRHADAVLGKEGIANDYGKKYIDIDNQNDYKVDVVLYSLNQDCIAKLNQFAKKRFHDLNDQYRRAVARLDEQRQKRFKDIVKNGNKISELNLTLPESIGIKKAETSDAGDTYYDHLYVDEKTMSAKIGLNQWEKDIIREEQSRSDFVCWYRNPSRSVNSLCIKYLHNGVDKGFYPDFIIVRKDATNGYIIDILEPHNPAFDDNVGKAKALAEYANRHSMILGRVELIRGTQNPKGYVRLDMCKSEVREAVLKIQNAEELDHLFYTTKPEVYTHSLDEGFNSPKDSATEVHYHFGDNTTYIENQTIKKE